MSQEELLLQSWRSLAPLEQAKVLQFTRLLHSESDLIDGPEHLKIRSREQLDVLVQAGLDSLDRGEGTILTDEWWEQERAQLVARFGS